MFKKILMQVPYLGIGIVAVGIVGGFGYLFAGNDDMAKLFLMIIPVGFLILFVGVVTNILIR